ncbi:hypothetical protein LN344_06865 [Lacticaseibacillus paracasei subsp. paracasei]|uniref:hypothetical protein n=1 Tax=Lacticaseibacillus paracasei TaxID=1597 RepID=UPI001E653656|nr:hypothetical protein [Lacticaseibacillus paracasei]MCD0433078.1 hypothetical protein [Lacticaseibacillus paracasei subsp. paracasei]
MKLNILEMQALEFASLNLGLSFTPWYRGEDGLFAPTFFRKDDSGIIGSRTVPDGPDREIKLAINEGPLLFDWTLKRHNAGDKTSPSELVYAIQAEEKGRKEQADQHIVGATLVPFPLSSLATVKLESGLVLTDVTLAQSEYDLVGFEQS